MKKTDNLTNVFSKTYTLDSNKTVVEKPSKNIPIAIVILILVYLSAKVTGFSFATIIRNGKNLTFILKELIKANLHFIPNVVGPLMDTLKMSLLGSFAGAVLALPFAFLASYNMISNRIVNWIVRFLFSLLRTIPTLVNALIATYIFGLGTLAGTVAIFIYSFSYVGKLTYEQIETVDMGAFEAMISMGYTKPMAFMKGILPLIIPVYVSTALYNFEGNVRYAAILGYVGAGGLGLVLNETIGWRQYDNAGAILLCLFITVMVIENASKFLRNRLS